MVTPADEYKAAAAKAVATFRDELGVELGGVIHWTHHDPMRLHPPGWIRHNDELYQ